MIALGVIAALLVGSLGQQIGRSTADYAYDQYKEVARDRSIEEQLEQAAQERNQKLPTMAATNEHIEIDAVAARPGLRLTYLVAVNQLDQITDDHLRALIAGTRDRLCSSNLRRLLDQGVTFIYRYRDSKSG